MMGIIGYGHKSEQRPTEKWAGAAQILTPR